MRTIDAENFKNKKVLIRVDFNVPLDEQFQVKDDTRIRAAVPTIKKVLDDGGSAILMSHLGRPKGITEKYSLKHLMPVLQHIFRKDQVFFASDCIGEIAEQAAKRLQPGQILLLENLRFYPEEEKGDVGFAKQLAALGDFYVNDAFGTAHRRHASTAVIASYFPEHKALGFLMAEEIRNISKVLDDIQHPYVAIIGGAKVSSKINILRNLADKVDHLIIGGGMVFTFIKAQGGSIGSSLVEEGMLSEALEILKVCEQHGVKVNFPIDSVCSDRFGADAIIKTCHTNSIDDGFMGLDIGPQAINQFQEIIMRAKTILWNGPMGVFEMSAFKEGTRQIALSVAASTKAGAFSLVGGGDSVAAINTFHLADEISYVSTGGGAMLEYMEGVILPGIAAIEENQPAL